MLGLFDRKRKGACTFLGRLRSDVRGNTLAIMAIALFPLIGIVGSGLDTARTYLVRSRLQQACDAGVLAGRKFMIADGQPTLDPNSDTQAKSFFKNNFKDGWLGTSGTKFTPVKSADKQMSATASTSVPMTLMRMFGFDQTTINVSCQANLDVPDMDVMFVLDTTGSMACPPLGCSTTKLPFTRENGTTGIYSEEVAGSKMQGLRNAVLLFYDTLASSADPLTNIRYGFVPYSISANVGGAITSLNPSYMASASKDTPTRRVNSDYVWSDPTRMGLSAQKIETLSGYYTNADCTAKQSRTPAKVMATDPTGVSYMSARSYNANGTAVRVTADWKAAGIIGGVVGLGTCKLTTDTVTPLWDYSRFPVDLTPFTSFAWVSDPTKVGTDATKGLTKWAGCIEERVTTQAATSFDQNNLPADLDPDAVPTSNDTKWKPLLYDIEYYRPNFAASQSSGTASAPPNGRAYGDVRSTTGGDYTGLSEDYNKGRNSSSACGKPAQRLKVLSRSDIENYLSFDKGFVATGGTYHDIGMIWGTRMLSPTGIFKADTQPWPERGEPRRYIVFMTDGLMEPNKYAATGWGVEPLQERIGTHAERNDDDAQIKYHDARFLAECVAAKRRGITVFVFAFGKDTTPSLDQCSSEGKAIVVKTNDALAEAFKQLATRIALLRLKQ